MSEKKTKKYNSVEDIKEHREEIDNACNGNLPDYLLQYFDNAEKKKRTEEYFDTKRSLKYSKTNEEKKEYYAAVEKEFWENNTFKIIKKKRRVPGNAESVYIEPLRNSKRVDDEKDLSQEEIKILIKLCETDLYLFAIRYFSHFLRKPSSRFHKYLYTYLSENTNNRRKHSRGFKHAIAAPRGSSKSSIISAIYPLWCICYNKKKFIIIVSDTAGQAEDFLADIKREIDNNALLLRDFPYLSGKGPVWRADEIITKNDIKLLALGTGSKIRGRRFGTYRPDLVICDDIENSDMLRSESDRKHIRFSWFNKEALHVYGEKGTYTDFLFVGTILGKAALLYALLNPEEYPDWKGITFKAVYSDSDSELWEEWEELYKNRFDEDRINTARKFFEDHKEEMLEGTEVLWPEGDPYYDLMVVKISDMSAYMSEKQNNPLDPTKIIITFDELRFENFNLSPWHDIIRDKRNPIYGSLDPSLGKKQSKGDPSCITTIIKDLKTGFILVFLFSLKRRTVDRQIEDILIMHKNMQLTYGRGYKLFSVESNIFQLVIAQNLKKLSRSTGVYVPIHEAIVKNDKKARFEKHVPLLRDGTVIFDVVKNSNTMQYNKAVDQISTFVGDGSDTNDDAVDGISLALDLVTTPTFKLRTKNNN
jgi:hypothetical protein